MTFRDKVVLVTGSSRGLGKEMLLGFAREGARVAINYQSSKAEAEKLKDEIDDEWNQAIAIQADVGDVAQVERMFETIISEYGRIDVLINNAAIYEDSTVWKMTPEVWDKVIRSDLTSVFNCTKFAAGHMREQRYGRIINISSVVGLTGVFGTSNYAAAKAGIFGLTKTVAKELATRNITVNALTFGYFDAGMLVRLPEEVQQFILKQIPMKRWGKPSEAVATAKFLASEGAGYITGQVINVNGGYYM